MIQNNNQYEAMMQDFERYKKNRQNVPLETLKTKYRKPYEALKLKLKEELQWYVRQLSFLGIYEVLKKDKDDLIPIWREQIEKIYQEEEAKGLPKLLERAIYRHMDMREFETLVCETLTNRIHYEVYAPYWLKNCRTENGKITNDLLDGMVWDPEHNLWEGKTEEGNPCWTVKLPPTQELIDKEKNEDRESFEKWMKELEAKEKKEETA